MQLRFSRTAYQPPGFPFLPMTSTFNTILFCTLFMQQLVASCEASGAQKAVSVIGSKKVPKKGLLLHGVSPLSVIHQLPQPAEASGYSLRSYKIIDSPINATPCCCSLESSFADSRNSGMVPMIRFASPRARYASRNT